MQLFKKIKNFYDAAMAWIAGDEEEYLLRDDDNDRFVLFPIKHHDVFAEYKKCVESFWTPGEIDMSRDQSDWNDKLTDAERTFVKHVLAFFAASDGIVNENLASSFYDAIKIPEIRCFYGFQIAMENIHSETYSLFIDTLIPSSERESVFGALKHMPTVAKKAEWSLKWIDPINNSFQTRLVAFAIVEGLFFCGSFAAIFWLKKRGLMPGLAHSNELISRDEISHYKFARLIYNTYIEKKLPDQQIRGMIDEAVRVESEFFKSAITSRLDGINSHSMIRYIKYVADNIAMDFCEEKKTMFGETNPFEFMESILMEGKTNFFEKRVSEYKKMSEVRHGKDGRFIKNESFLGI